jgi:hypothetical protein
MKKKFFERNALCLSPLSIFMLCVFGVALFLNIVGRDEQQFVDLAKSFLQAKLYFITQVPLYDTISIAGKQYWPLGPFPGVLLMPFVALASLVGFEFYQGYLQFFLSVGILFMVYRLAYLVGFSRKDSQYMACAFTLGSMYLAMVFLPIYGFFAHVVTVFLLSGALVEYYGARRYWAIGSIMALVAATRLTAGLGIIFFICDILFLSSKKGGEKIRSFIALCVPFVISMILLGLYNFARFGDVFEQGYALQTLLMPDLFRSREYGLLSPVFLPANVYYAFVSLPIPVLRDQLASVFQLPFLRPSSWGMSIFATSPYLLTLFFSRFRERVSRFLLLTCCSIAAPIFLYYGIGYWQFGYRYALDFFPFLFLLFLIEYRRKHDTLTRGMKWVIVLSGLANLYLFFSLILYGG